MRISTHMLRDGYRVARPLLFRMDPERIHETTIHALGAFGARRRGVEAHPVEIAGVRFPNRVGVAAGLDKDGIAAKAWAHLGFGHAELGTVTALPQPGNAKPRLFRAVASRGIINKMGFNNQGSAALAERLRGYGVQRGNMALGIPLGVSIGKSKVVALEDAVDDYLQSLQQVAPYADYVAVNVSSPNTPGLRQLQNTAPLERLLQALVEEAAQLDNLPIFVKLAPDLDSAQLQQTVRIAEGCGVSAIIAGNTTLSREHLAADDQRLASKPGGMSGAPLTARALRFVDQTASSSELPVIGVGGIMSPRDAARMFDAGAQLVQLYTGFIYEGPALVRGIHEWSK
ncbi:MAG: quinone-dependent dihydroorotate dehydrogenase [Propionibacteriaceae bacterium]|nr:quinone-dependent dihydroorotate dehydrogenase [Propionibacteriaceae bacterium]